MIDRQKYLDRGWPPEDIGPMGMTHTLEARIGQARSQFLEEFEETHGREPTEAEDDAICYTSVAYGRKQHQLVTDFKATHHRSPTEAEYQPLCQQARAYSERLYQLLSAFKAAHGRNATDEEYDALSEQASTFTEPRADGKSA